MKLALVSHVVGACPGCGKNSFGNIDVRGDHISQGCGNCRYHREIPLPPIRKKVLYLDQFFFSHAFRAGNPKFLEAARRIRALTAKQLIVVPYSDVHENETAQWERYEELLDFVKTTARGYEFLSQYNVEHTQIKKGFDAFLKGKSIEFIIERDDVFEDDLDVWDGYYRIDIERLAPDRDEIKTIKRKLADGLIQLFPIWRSAKNTLEQNVAFEDQAAGQHYLQTFGRRMKRILEGDFSASENEHIDSLVVENLITFFPEQALMKDKISKITEFFSSDHFKNIPHRYVASRIFALLKKMVQDGAYQNAEIALEKLSGFYSDVDHIATYAPYCDAFLMDRAMAEMVTRREVALTGKYGVKVFSRSSWDEMLAWFDELEATVTPDHERYLRLAYPDMVYGES